jgi:hypothetical protein
MDRVVSAQSVTLGQTGALAVERSEQRVVKDYRKRRDAEAETGKKQGDTEGRRKGAH